MVAPRELAWRYEVRVEKNLDVLVDATFGRTTSALVVEDGGAPFLDDFAAYTGARFEPTPLAGFDAKTRCAQGCRLRYRFRLQQAADGIHDAQQALAAGGALFAPPSTWLLHPDGDGAERYRMHVTTAEGVRFVTAVHPVRGARDTYEATLDSFYESTFAAFGALRTPAVAGLPVELVVAPEIRFSDAVLSGWVSAELSAIRDYLGGFPTDRAVVFMAPGTAAAMRGVTLGGGGPSVLVRIGTTMTEPGLRDDWVLAHELLHVGFPSVEPGHRWLTEGLASYVEPIVRVRAGLLTEERFWKELFDGLPQGLPAPGDRGLLEDDSWGRTYWGGALYCFLADVTVRERTRNARSLDDALRAIGRTGTDVEVTWPVERVLEEADRATGTRVFHELYDRLARAPGTVDLEELRGKLGVEKHEGGVRFNDAAPFSDFRKAITRRSDLAH